MNINMLELKLPPPREIVIPEKSQEEIEMEKMQIQIRQKRDEERKQRLADLQKQK